VPLTYRYLRQCGLDHSQALFKLELEALLARYGSEERGAGRAGVLAGIIREIEELHGRVAEYTGRLATSGN